MADKSFDRVGIGFREKPVSDDMNRMQSQIDRTMRDVLSNILAPRAGVFSEGAAPANVFCGTGFSVSPSSPVAMTVQVNGGLGFQYLPADTATDIGAADLLGVDDLAPFRPLLLDSPQVFSVPTAPPVTNKRIDLIEVRANRGLVDQLTRRKFNEITGAFDPHNYYKTLTHALDGLVGSVAAPNASTAAISYKVGVESASPTIPTVTPGYVAIAGIVIDTAATTIPANHIIDLRKLAAPGGVLTGSFRVRCQGTTSKSYTISDACLPPGVKIGVSQYTTDRGNARIHIVAGNPTRATVNIDAGGYDDTGIGFAALIPSHSPDLGSSYLLTVDSTYQGYLSSGGIPAAIGQKAVVVRNETYYLASGGGAPTAFDTSNAVLEDIAWNVSFSLIY